RGVVGEPGVAPRVQVADLAYRDVVRDDQVVEPVAATPPLPGPAELAHLGAVQRAECVAEAELLEPLEQRQLGPVVALAALRAELAGPGAGECPDAAVGMLAPRRVEIPTDHAWPGARRQVRVHRLVRAHLDQT